MNPIPAVYIGCMFALAGCVQFAPTEMYCRYNNGRMVGPDYQSEQGTPRALAAPFAGSFVVRPVWLPADAGVPEPGELDELLVIVAMAEGRAHVLHTDLDTAVSAEWCPDTQLEAGLTVGIRNAGGDFWAADPGGKATVFVGPGPRGLRGEGSHSRGTIPVLRYPDRWEVYAAPFEDGWEFEYFEISAVVASTFGGLLDEDRVSLPGIRVQVVQHSDVIGGSARTNVPFRGIAWMTEEVR